MSEGSGTKIGTHCAAEFAADVLAAPVFHPGKLARGASREHLT